MPSIPFVDKGEEVYVGRDAPVKGDLAEVLFSIYTLVFVYYFELERSCGLSFSSPSLPLCYV